MRDKERILFTIIQDMAMSGTLYAAPVPDHPFPRVHFAAYREPVAGELVLCTSVRGPFDWLIGWAVEPIEVAGLDDGWVLREIGSERICRCTNMGFYPLVGLRADDLLEGRERKFLTMAEKAISSIDSYDYRFDGVRFADDTAYVGVRAPYGGRWKLGPDAMMAHPFEVDIHDWRKIRSIVNLASHLTAGGVGTREFTMVPDEVERARFAEYAAKQEVR